MVRVFLPDFRAVAHLLPLSCPKVFLLEFTHSAANDFVVLVVNGRNLSNHSLDVPFRSRISAFNVFDGGQRAALTT
jgi:hypothetical protein